MRPSTRHARHAGRVAAALLLALVACGPSTGKPAGTSSDPVTVCERLADVCKLDGNRLGVCTASGAGAGFTCASQH